jgi:hypothetical protein
VDKQNRVLTISTLVGAEWSASCPGHFILKERTPNTHWLGDWMDPRTSLNYVEAKLLGFPLVFANNDLMTDSVMTFLHIYYSKYMIHASIPLKMLLHAYNCYSLTTTPSNMYHNSLLSKQRHVFIIIGCGDKEMLATLVGKQS